MGAAADGFIATTSLPVVVAPLSAFSNQRRSKLAFSLCINAIAATDTPDPWQAAHYFRFEFIRVSPPFAAPQRCILVNSVHLSAYSLSGYDAPKAAAPIQHAITRRLHNKHIRAHWHEILRLATSIKQGTVTASLMLRKLGSYPRQNGLAVALRELGRIARTLFILDWLQSVEQRRRVHAGLNKGKVRNALARAVFFYRFEKQRYRASGLILVTAAIVLWNTVYMERATGALRGHGHLADDRYCNTCRRLAGNTST
jgi:hypothetical protein